MSTINTNAAAGSPAVALRLIGSPSDIETVVEFLELINYHVDWDGEFHHTADAPVHRPPASITELAILIGTTPNLPSRAPTHRTSGSHSEQGTGPEPYRPPAGGRDRRPRRTSRTWTRPEPQSRGGDR